jgi:hypothetical protein
MSKIEIRKILVNVFTFKNRAQYFPDRYISIAFTTA